MKILIVRVGRLGDLVMITPALTLIKEHYPTAQFDLLIGAQGKQLIPFLPVQFDQIHAYNRKSLFQLYHRHQIKKKLAANPYDAIFCFETNHRYKKLFPPDSTLFFPISSDHHSCKIALDTVNWAVKAQTELSRRRYPLKLSIDADLIKKTEDYFLAQGIDHDTFVVAIHPSFSGVKKPGKIFKRRRHKKWNSENYADCAGRIDDILKQNSVKHCILMNLLPEDRAIGSKIKNLSHGVVREFLLPTGFKHFVGYLNRIDLLIVPDTGPMHIAAGLNTNVIALFSGEHPDRCGAWTLSSGITNIRAENFHPKGGINHISGKIVADVFAQKLSLFMERAYIKRKMETY